VDTDALLELDGCITVSQSPGESIPVTDRAQ